jgi:hypothetical protein
MRWTVGCEHSRSNEGLAHAEKRIPIPHGQRQVRVFRGSLWLRAMRVNEEDVASGGSDQDEWHVPRCLAHG